jgi:hypothetical protein
MMRTVLMGSGVAVLVSATAAAQAPAEDEAVAEDEAMALDEAADEALAPPAPLAPLPGPFPFVSGLDLECYATPGPALNIPLTLKHLNPVLIGLGLPTHNVVVRELQQTCVPVMKNGVAPAPAALPFIRHVDLACYRVDAAVLPAPTNINLRHLNPVLANLPSHNFTLVAPQQLCVPMGKNGVALPPDVLDLVRYIDLECYRGDPTTTHPSFGVGLTQLNPQLTGIPNHGLTLSPQNRQVCVPVQKNNQVIPPGSLNLIKWLDLEKFPAAQPVNIPPKAVVLDHLNPLFATLPRVPVTLQTANALMVPVAKNGQIPPP